jgi:hypothetical protein
VCERVRVRVRVRVRERESERERERERPGSLGLEVGTHVRPQNRVERVMFLTGSLLLELNV